MQDHQEDGIPIKKVGIPLISFTEFYDLILQIILKDSERNSAENFCINCLNSGFPKLDKDNIHKFMKDIQEFCFFGVEPVIVDFGDSHFYWFVSGSEAIMFNKKDLTIS